VRFGKVYQGRRVLLTGHTGFKGSWLALWLQALGAKVVGISLPAETAPNHWGLLGLDMESHDLDIRDRERLRQCVLKARPELVFHLAAQPLVRRSYLDPLGTWATNVMGTAHLLDACREVDSLAAALVITTDKCYKNNEWDWGYREIDPLGGHDPYSASKAGSELVVESYRRSFFSGDSKPLLASARAGNVIGGGDWSEDRLVPDLVRAVEAGVSLEIRSPRATRPWQHVLDCLSGYLLLGQKLLEGRREFAEAWNFGPEPAGNRTVEDMLATLQRSGLKSAWRVSSAPQPAEAQLLYLDSAKARNRLGWRPAWNFEASVERTADWYSAWLTRREVLSATQLEAYSKAASST